MLRSLGNFFNRFMERWLPDAYLFAIGLTFLSFVLALVFVPQVTPMGMILAWGNGLWGLLAFSMQMTLILVTGHALALAPAVRNVLRAIAGTAKSPQSAVFIVTLVTGIASWIQWGFGLVVGGLLAREMARRQKAHFPLLVASAYAGYMIWHMGLSSSVGLTIASKGNAANHIEKLYGKVVPVTDTIFASFNWITALVLLLTLPVVMYLSYPRPEEVRALDHDFDDDAHGQAAAAAAGPVTPAVWAENSFIINLLLCAGGFTFVVHHFLTKGFVLDLNIVIMIFLFLGALLHRTPINYVRAVNVAIRGAGGIALQFPLYAGIQGIMGAGLAKVIAGWFVAVSGPATFYLFQFWAAGLINLFIPSGGGQWAAQGMISLEAAKAAGFDPVKTAIMVSWGDQWTNMIQPFWALPLLALAGLRAKDIMGYTTVALLWGGVVMGLVAVIIAL